MRRRDPAYRLPQLKHTPPPPGWQLYVAQDGRSGPDFATVAYVDTTKARPTPTGFAYDDDAIRIPLGVIPVRPPAGSKCSVQKIVDLLGAAAFQQRLLVPAPGGFRSAISGLPAAKADWSKADSVRRFNKLCTDLESLIA
jgi:hypothetical protein